MKTKSTRSLRFNSKLAAYSATATAALLAAPTAEAAIRNITTFSYDGGATFGTTPPQFSLLSASSFNINLSFTGATAAFARGIRGSMAVYSANNTFEANNRIYMHARSGGFGGVASNGSRSVGPNIKDLSYGASIVKMANFYGSLLAFKMFSSAGTHVYGSFVPIGSYAAKTGYVGFRTINSHGNYYGWLRVKVANLNSAPFEVSLVDKNGDGIYGAFGLKSDNITAGEIAPVPEPSVAAIGGLGLLALGANGLRELRRRRQPTAGN